MAAVYDLRTIGALIDNSSLVSAGELFVWMFVVGQFENIVDACDDLGEFSLLQTAYSFTIMHKIHRYIFWVKLLDI